MRLTCLRRSNVAPLVREVSGFQVIWIRKRRYYGAFNPIWSVRCFCQQNSRGVMNIPKNPMTFRQMYLGFRSGKKKMHPRSPVRSFGDTKKSDPQILGTPKRVKFEDSCGQKSSLGISNDLKLGQVLHTDDTKILAKSCPDPSS